MIVAVTGGKGGTGKSTVATALAVELTKKGKVLLVDADVDCPNDHLLLGIKRKKLGMVKQRIPQWDFKKCTKCGACGSVCRTHAIVAIKGQKPIFLEQQCNGCGACELKCPAGAISWMEKEIGMVFGGKGKGIDFLSGELNVKEPLSEKIVEALMAKMGKARGEYDFVVVDTAAGTHCDVIGALKGAEIVFAVAEATPLGAHDLELIIELLNELGLKFEVVLNKSGEGKDELVGGIVEKMGKGIAARIPYKKEIMQAYCRGIPIRDEGIEKIAELVAK